MLKASVQRSLYGYGFKRLKANDADDFIEIKYLEPKKQLEFERFISEKAARDERNEVMKIGAKLEQYEDILALSVKERNVSLDLIINFDETNTQFFSGVLSRTRCPKETRRLRFCIVDKRGVGIVNEDHSIEISTRTRTVASRWTRKNCEFYGRSSPKWEA